MEGRNYLWTRKRPGSKTEVRKIGKERDSFYTRGKGKKRRRPEEQAIDTATERTP